MRKFTFLFSVILLLQTAFAVARADDVVIDCLHYELKGDIAELTCRNRETDLPSSIVIPSNITYEGKVYQVLIGEGAFTGCLSIKSVVISEGITVIPEEAFYSCYNLENLTIPESVDSIGRKAFDRFSKLKTEIIDGVIYLNDVLVETTKRHATYHAIREGTRIIADEAFKSCLLRYIDIPDGVKYIGSNAFALCRSLKDVCLPESVISIGDKAFYMCNALESIDIPNGVSSIGNDAFGSCLALKSVTIPSSDIYIANNAFAGCRGLKKINTPDDNLKKQIKSNLSLRAKKQKRGLHRGHGYVDLGLSVKWATCNVGASRPEEAGDFYAWGEIKTKYNKRKYRKNEQKRDLSREFDVENYLFFDRWETTEEYPGSEAIFTKYNDVDHKCILDPEDDVAHVKWGGSWRMPTIEEIQELKDNCTWSWSVMNGVYGQKITSNVPGYEGRFIFIPAPVPDSGVQRGSYWSRERVSDTGSAADLLVDDWGNSIYFNAASCTGCMIRPVCP